MKQFKKSVNSIVYTISKWDNVLLWIVGAYYAEIFIRNGWRKFDPEGFWSHSFLEAWGFSLWFMYLIGLLEFVFGIFLLVPKLRPIGSFVLAVIMIGALCTKTIHGFINGFNGSEKGIYAVINNLDLIFFLGTIAILLFLMSYQKKQSSSID